MAKHRNHPAVGTVAVFIFICSFIVTIASCSDAKGPEDKQAIKKISFKQIVGHDQLDAVIAENANRLLVLDFYADWCRPCVQLEPILKELSHTLGNRMAVYKINIDENREIAADLGVGSIPYLLLVRQGQAVDSIMGLYPKQNYMQLFQKYAPNEAAMANAVASPDGTIEDGVRMIRRNISRPLQTLRIYRGETIRLIFDADNRNFAISIPAFDIEAESRADAPLEVRFKAKDEGEFPVFCSGDCPDTGDEFGKIVVMAYQGTAESQYRELSAQQASEFIRTENPLILDVRTQGEYETGHIKGAKLIPVQELASRIDEIQAYRDKDVFIYCRSGNRSTVAAEILSRAGFRKLHNLRYGIIEWQRDEYPVETPERTASN